MVGLIELVRVVRSYLANRNGGPGDTHFVECKGIGGAGMNVEVYGPPGMISRPPKDARGVFVPIGRGKNYGIVIAMHNYKVSVWCEEGGTTIFSTNTAGDTVKAQIELDASGKVRVANETKSLKTVLDTLIGHIRDLATINCVSGSPVTLSVETILNLNNDMTALAALMKD